MLKRMANIFFILVVLLAAGLRIYYDLYGVGDFLTREERQWLRKHYRDIVVAPDPRWAPDRLVRDQQIYRGISQDFMALIEKKLGVRFLRLHTQNWAQLMAAEAEGRVDIHPVLFQTDDRSQDWYFTDPYMRIPVIAVMRASLKDQFHPEQIWEMSMAVGQGYGIENFLQQHSESINLVPIESDLFGMLKTSLGEIDVMVTDLASASHYIEAEGLTNLRLAATLGTMYEFRLASRRSLPVLHTILNKAVNRISREERRQIYDRWIVFDVRPFYESPSFWYTAGAVLAAVLAIIGIILVWNTVLKREVDHKTRELQAAQRELEARVEQRTHELAQANESLRIEMQQRAELAKDVLHISGSERTRIGRDLHDSIGQKLVGVLFLGRALESRLQSLTAEDAETVTKIVSALVETINDMKRIVRGLLPVDILNEGLVAALESMLRQFESIDGITCTLTCEPESGCDFQDNVLATNIYRLVQEAVGNAVKHAHALSTVEVRLVVRQHEGVIEVHDDGKGAFDPSHRFHGMGLKIMRYRAMLMGGELDIRHETGHGTTLHCVFDPNTSLDEDEEIRV